MSRHALVIGAGLAGAAVCAQLARRGWRITLLEAADGPARGASALPVGMLSPHVTRAPTPLSRLSALGVDTTRGELQRLLPQGQGWQACEVDNLGHDQGRWPAALVRPGALVHAWLDEAGPALQARWRTPVHGLARTGDQAWQALDATGSVLAQAPVLVVAAAFDSLALLTTGEGLLPQAHLPLRPVKGQMSLAALDGEALADRPRRDNGVFVPRYDDSGLPPAWPARIWAMGSTYTRGDASTHLSDEAHAANASSLQALCPPAAERMRQTQARGALLGWAQVRCASLDRLPLVGAAVDTVALNDELARARGRHGRIALEDMPRLPGLHLCTAFGSRGITLAPLCAALLAARLEEDASPLEPDLVRALDPARFAWRQARRQVQVR
ncbi:FAD-dependent oxidoreductase [Hydrogenophaga sp.]|uniref:FAD-dependent oxidoreductase n=1 Tax=Hydrogenophaga sp. TaxID=1904254 RepID=UPI00260BE148|nr:FAD-dependent oxidoreductase [Hydrogenophaga sp.]MCW5655911.1 FAD-dependent oxidoreductase [Hydrogenophaga sp.]